MKISISTKIMGVAFLLSLLIAVLLTGSYYFYSYSLLEYQMGKRLEHVAVTAALGISGDEHDRIAGPEHFDTPAFRNIKSHLNEVMLGNDLTHETIYTFRPLSEEKLKFCVMLHETPFIGDVYKVPERNHAVVERVLQGEVASTGIYADDHGRWISGMAPIANSQGEVTGILEVDYPIDAVLSQMEYKLRVLALLALGVIGLGLVLSYWLARTISRPLKDLRNVALQVREGDYDVHMPVFRTRDEVGDLSAAFADMVMAIQFSQDEVREEQKKSESLLLNILPAAVCERLKSENRSIADAFANVTVLFTDIVGFTRFSEGRPPAEVVELLNALFSRFDSLAEEHGVEKIKTIGDSYMAAAGLPVESEDHAGAIAELALDMLQVVEEFEETRPDLRIRIGINTGPVVAGVIGTKKFIYDLWSETVNIASRMESLSKPGLIQVSEYSYVHLKDRYEFQKRGTLISKKKKEIHTTYFMLGRKQPALL